MTSKIRLTFITDEVSQDIGEAISFAKHFGITALELRSVDGLSPFQYTEETVAKIKSAITESSMTVPVMSSPLFKCSISDEEAVSEHISSFERIAKYANKLGAKYIRGFDFFESGATLEERAEKFVPIIEICKKYGITLLIEYDPTLHSSTPEKTAQLVSYINDPSIGALYDPGNGLWSVPDEAPYPTAYETLKPYLHHIHIKDAMIIDGAMTAVRVGDGLVDYNGLIRRLIVDGYDGYLSLETHYRKNSTLSEEQLKLPGGYGFSAGAYEASFESMENLINIIEKVKKEV